MGRKGERGKNREVGLEDSE